MKVARKRSENFRQAKYKILKATGKSIQTLRATQQIKIACVAFLVKKKIEERGANMGERLEGTFKGFSRRAFSGFVAIAGLTRTCPKGNERIHAA